MNDKKRVVAERFSIYIRLSPLDQWRFRRLLRWVSQDAVSLELFLDFDEQLEAKSLLGWEIPPNLKNALNWYNRECDDNKIENPMQRYRLPEMLQVVLPFLARSQALHSKYRELILKIIDVSDNVGKGSTAYSATFLRIEVAKVISNLSQHWETWNPYLKDESVRILSCLERIASRVNDLQLFTQFQLEITKVLPNVQQNIRFWDPNRKDKDRRLRYSLESADSTLGYLETIANQVNDLESFAVVFQEVAPVIGLEATASILAMSRDFQEFLSYYLRITAQLGIWRSDFHSLFRRRLDFSELGQVLGFLETLTRDPRLQKCFQYNESKNTKFAEVSLKPFPELRTICLTDKWKDRTSTSGHLDDLIRLYVKNIVQMSLSSIWGRAFPKEIRWEFDTFTEHIPYEKRILNWTIDNTETRQYWNWQDAANSENKRFQETLAPRLCLIFDELEHTDYDLLVELIPRYFITQRFTKKVRVPIAWEKHVVLQEGYQLHVGFYDEKVEVARPKDFAEHTFTFERPDLQHAVNLLESMDRVHEAIEAHKKARRSINS